MGAELPLLLQIIPVLEEITGQPRRSVSSDPTQSSLLQQQSAEECKNRFNYAFRRFIRVIGSFGPLIMFLDDLQWADLGSLELLEVLITDRENSNLMIIGSYRSNEVEDSHPLAKTIREIPAKCDSGGFHITEVTLGNLNVQDVNELLLDLLSSEDGSIQIKSLADICHAKTHGNAFFLLHFLILLDIFFISHLIFLLLKFPSGFLNYKIHHQKCKVNRIIQLHKVLTVSDEGCDFNSPHTSPEF